jgi:hypothetical protein
MLSHAVALAVLVVFYFVLSAGVNTQVEFKYPFTCCVNKGFYYYYYYYYY